MYDPMSVLLVDRIKRRRDDAAQARTVSQRQGTSAMQRHIATLLSLALLTAACASQAALSTAPVGAEEVEMRNDTFVPEVIEVPVATTVTWHFNDNGRGHDVVGDGFGSPVQRDGTFTHTFTTAGSYDYRCTLHRHMHGRVIVTDQ